MKIAPREVPALVSKHWDYVGNPNYQDFAGGFFMSIYRNLPSDQDGVTAEQAMARKHGLKNDQLDWDAMGRRWSLDERENLIDADQFFVSESMMRVAEMAAEHLPDDSLWNPETVPARQGVLVFETPLFVTDAHGLPMSIAAFSWSTADVASSGLVAGWFVSLNFYTDPNTPGDAYNEIRQKHLEDVRKLNQRDEITLRRANLGQWELCHFGTHRDQEMVGPSNLGTPHGEVLSDTGKESGNSQLEKGSLQLVEFRGTASNLGRLTYSLMQLMQQTVASTSEYTDRKMVRRNAGKPPRPASSVTIVQLRRESDHGARDETTGRWLTYRAVTRGHWRNQPFGPGRQLTRKIWINPYVRGDASLPFNDRKVVSTLVR